MSNPLQGLGGRLPTLHSQTCTVCMIRAAPHRFDLQVLCDVRTVSWAMANLRVDTIDLLKIDVEGTELVSSFGGVFG